MTSWDIENTEFVPFEKIEKGDLIIFVSLLFLFDDNAKFKFGMQNTDAFVRVLLIIFCLSRYL